MDQARDEHRQAVAEAGDDAAREAAAAAWLQAIDRLNQSLAVVERDAEQVLRHATEMERDLATAQMNARAARIASEAAAASCLEARRELAACEQAETVAPATPSALSATRDVAILARLLQGDGRAISRISQEIAVPSDTGAQRLQLLLNEFCQQVRARALEELWIGVPSGQAFWGQLSAEERRRVIVSLAALGHRFDGLEGWIGRPPNARDLAMAISHAGFDPRSLRRPADQQEIDDLWRGARILADEFLLTYAPDLELGDVTNVLGPRGTAVGELWNVWGRLRPLLLSG